MHKKRRKLQETIISLRSFQNFSGHKLQKQASWFYSDIRSKGWKENSLNLITSSYRNAVSQL